MTSPPPIISGIVSSCTSRGNLHAICSFNHDSSKYFQYLTYAHPKSPTAASSSGKRPKSSNPPLIWYLFTPWDYRVLMDTLLNVLPPAVGHVLADLDAAASLPRGTISLLLVLIGVLLPLLLLSKRAGPASLISSRRRDVVLLLGECKAGKTVMFHQVCCFLASSTCMLEDGTATCLCVGLTVGLWLPADDCVFACPIRDHHNIIS